MQARCTFVAFVAPKLGNSAIPMTELVVNQTNMVEVTTTAGIEDASMDNGNEIVARIQSCRSED